MAQKCFMCGAAIARGILCEKCDKPRKPKESDEGRVTPAWTRVVRLMFARRSQPRLFRTLGKWLAIQRAVSCR